MGANMEPARPDFRAHKGTGHINFPTHWRTEDNLHKHEGIASVFC